MKFTSTVSPTTLLLAVPAFFLSAAQPAVAVHTRGARALLERQAQSSPCAATKAIARSTLHLLENSTIPNNAYVWPNANTSTSDGCNVVFCDETTCPDTVVPYGSQKIQLPSYTTIALAANFSCTGGHNGFAVNGTLTLDCIGNKVKAVGTLPANSVNKGLFMTGGAMAQNCLVKDFHTGVELQSGGLLNSLVTNNTLGVVAANMPLPEPNLVANVWSVANDKFGLLASADSLVSFAGNQSVFCGNGSGNLVANRQSIALTSTPQSVVCTDGGVSATGLIATGLCRPSTSIFKETCSNAGYCG